MPKGTDESLLSKLEARLSGHGHFRVEKAAGGALRGDFTIVHYAGEVSYSCRGLLEKNRDTLFRDLVELCAQSSCPLIRELLPPAATKSPRAAGGGGQAPRRTLSHTHKTRPAHPLSRSSLIRRAPPWHVCDVSATCLGRAAGDGRCAVQGADGGARRHHLGVRAALHPLHQAKRRQGGGQVCYRAGRAPGGRRFRDSPTAFATSRLPGGRWSTAVPSSFSPAMPACLPDACPASARCAISDSSRMCACGGRASRTAPPSSASPAATASSPRPPSRAARVEGTPAPTRARSSPRAASQTTSSAAR